MESKYIKVDEGVNLHYLIGGSGETILFLHGWPTSSYLWRNIMSELEDQFQVIALDLPGFGKSDKRAEDSYSFRYYTRVLDGFVKELGLEKLTLGIHDLGGPVGLYWLMSNEARVDRLIMLNTLVYPKFSYAVKLFYLSTVLPGIRSWISSPAGVAWAMKFGVYRKEKLTEEAIQEYRSPFLHKSDRKALLKSIQRLSLKGYADLSENLSTFKKPVQILYGAKDKILPKVGDTMSRVKSELPQAEVISFPNCGHFIQEEVPKELAEKMRSFMVNNPI